MKLLRFIKNVWLAMWADRSDFKSFLKETLKQLSFYGSLLGTVYILGKISIWLGVNTWFHQKVLKPENMNDPFTVGVFVLCVLLLILCAFFAGLAAWLGLKDIWNKS
jgi:hypothetical protein